MIARGIQPEAPLYREETSETSTYGLPSTPRSLIDGIGIARVRARRFFAAAYRQSSGVTRRAVIDLRNRARRAKEERPMAMLAAVAGSAFLLGISLRLWRSRR